MNQFNPGDRVRVLAPFFDAFPEEYVVETSYFVEADGIQIEQCSLQGIEPHFSINYLEKIE